MKKTSLFGILVLCGVLIGCDKEEATLPVTTNNMDKLAFEVGSKLVAGAIINFVENSSIANEIAEGVNEHILFGDDEHVAFNELNTNPGGFNALLEAAASKNKKLADFLEKNQLEIYFPFSMKWDEKKTPTISFTPSNSLTEGIGFVKDGGIIKEVLVNFDYCEKNPVWIIQKKTDINPIILKNKERRAINTRTNASKIVTKSFRVSGFGIERNNYDLLYDLKSIYSQHKNIFMLAGAACFFDKNTNLAKDFINTDLNQYPITVLSSFIVPSGSSKVIRFTNAKTKKAESISLFDLAPFPIGYTLQGYKVGSGNDMSAVTVETSVTRGALLESHFSLQLSKTNFGFSYSAKWDKPNVIRVTTTVKVSGKPKIHFNDPMDDAMFHAMYDKKFINSYGDIKIEGAIL